MKKFLSLGLAVILLSGCVGLDSSEYSDLKIKVLNLETLVKTHSQKMGELEERMNLLERQVKEEVSKSLVESQARVLADLQETKGELRTLQSKLEEMEFQKGEEGKLQRKNLEDLKTRLEGLELRIKELEEKLAKPLSPVGGASNQTLSNQTQPLSNQTQVPSHQTGISASRPEPPQASSGNKTSLKEKEEKPEKKEGEKPKEADLYQKAFSLFEKGDFKGAKALWEEYLKLYPKGKWVPQTHFYLGETYFQEKDYEASILEYQKVIESTGPNALKPRAMLRQGEAFLALKDKKVAQTLFKKVMQLYPGTKEAKEAKEKLNKLK